MFKLTSFFVFVVAMFPVGVGIKASPHQVIGIDAPRSAHQGDVVKVFVKGNGAHDIQFEYPNVKVLKIGTFDINEDLHFAIIPIAADENPGPGLLTVFSSNNFARSIVLEITKTDFPEDKRIWFVGEPNGKLKKRFDGEKAEMKRIFELLTPERFWKDNLKFSPPLKEMAITSPFGQVRHKKSAKEGRWDINHFGADLHANTGTPVFAAESGIVRIANHYLAEGNFVMIDHGYGLLTLYMHLSRLAVKEGVRVKAGEKIGQTGKTGYVTGPNLHFEVRLNGVAVSPWNFMPEPPMFEVNANCCTQHSNKLGVK